MTCMHGKMLVMSRLETFLHKTCKKAKYSITKSSCVEHWNKKNENEIKFQD